ncbi:MAG TPA: META domain-containing protein [Steroidobacteraceae bacterium]
MRATRARMGLLAAAALASACGAMPGMTKSRSLDGTAWVLEDLAGRARVGGSRPTLQFTGDRVSGSDGCNRYSGRYTVAQQAFKVVPPLATTQMACPGDIGEQARAYVEALTTAGSYQVVDGQLQLLAANGKSVATFFAQDTALAHTSWKVSGINNGKGAVVSLIADTSVTLEFGGDGQAGGWASCNRWSAGYTAERSALKFGQAAVTRKMCAEPGVMEQEQSFLQALASVSAARVEGDRLELRTAQGALALTLYRAGSD